MKDFSAFIDIIKEFIQLFESLISIEQTKLDASVKNRVSFVEDCMNKEQAAVLHLRGLEQKREKAQKQLGMENLTFREILENAPSEAADVLRPMFDKLSFQVRTFQALSESAKESIEINLHMLQKQAEVTNQKTYSPSGASQTDNNRHFTNRSV